MGKTYNLKKPYLYVIAALVLKALILIFAPYIHTMEEYASYAFDAIVITYCFYRFDRKEMHPSHRTIGVIVSCLVFMIEMFITNLFVTYLSCEARLGYQKTLAQCFQKDVDVFLKTGDSPYHLALVFIIILCVAVVIFDNHHREHEHDHDQTTEQ